MTFNKQIFLTTIVLISSIIFFALTDVDITLQDYFFNTQTHSWIVDTYAQPYRLIFYSGIKRLLIVIAVSFLLILIFFRNKKLIKPYRRGIIIVILSAILVPSAVGALKKYTNMPCPKNEIHYGGEYPRTAVWESYPDSFQGSKLKCWPAGHASGGFALLSLFFLFKSKKSKKIAFTSAMAIAWSMGLYKMLVGDHFLSHTIITMLLAWLIILLIAKTTLNYSTKRQKDTI
ncbi:MAG: phosphatase PAP2 family protein [Sulfurimonas sp.]